MLRRVVLWLGPLCLFAAAGAGPCSTVVRPEPDPLPALYQGEPTLDEIIQRTNERTLAVRQLQTMGATLTATGLPSLTAQMGLEPPRRFRLQAGTSLTGPELDVGSNDTHLWMWVRRDRPPAVYYASHEAVESGALRQRLPLEPQWLIEALGLVYFDPAARHDGPFPSGPDRVEIRSYLNRPEGTLLKVTVLHARQGQVLEQRIYNGAGGLMAAAIASNHQFDAASGAVLPRQIDVNLPTIPLQFTLHVSGYSVNRLMADPAQLWTMPDPDGAALINLADPRMPRLGPQAGNQPPPASSPANPGGLRTTLGRPTPLPPNPVARPRGWPPASSSGVLGEPVPRASYRGFPASHR